MTIYGHLGKRLRVGAQISIAKAKAGFASLVSRAEAGETIVVTRNGRPVASLGPLPPRRPIKYGDCAGTFVADDLSLPEEIFKLFEPESGEPK